MAGVSQIQGTGGGLTMNDPLFKNWLKAAYGFRYLKSGLEGFVSTQVGQRYSALKQQVYQHCPQCKILNQTVCPHVQPCSVCTSNNLLPDHGAKGCRRRDCFCIKRPKTRRKCPNNFCSVFYDLIVKDHAFNTPRCSSTYISAWFHDSLQYFKCFMGSDSRARSFDEIDCTGLLSIVIHNRHVHNSINDINLFIKCRDDRNVIFHTGNYEITDREVNDYIDDMINALEDGNTLVNDPTAKACVTSLNKLRNDQITITDVDILKLVQDSVVAINDLSDKVKQEIDDKRKHFLQEFDQRHAEAIKDIQNQTDKHTDQAVCKFDEHIKNGMRLLTEQRDNVISKINDQTNDGVRLLSEQSEKGISKIGEHTNAGVRLLRAKRDEDICNTEQASTSARISDEEIRNDLVKIYEEYCSTLPVSPLYNEDEDEMELLSVYQPPSMYHVPYHRTQEGDGRYPISSFKDIFCKDDQSFRKIYITGDAGVGKTSFCKRMSLLWCKSHSRERSSDRSVQDDIDFMSQFDFVFHVSLGETRRKDIVAIIVEQLFYCESDRAYEAIYESVAKILSRNKCVIVMDALDEWTPSESGKININRLCSDTCTFITTYRPYKLENERLTVRDIDRHVQMTGLTERSKNENVRKIVNRMNKANGENKDPDDFIRDVKRYRLGAQIRIPIIASHLIAVWFDDKLTNMCRALIYSNIVDMLLNRAEKTKHIELPNPQNESAIQFPDSLLVLSYLTRHGTLLKKISFLSFNVLFKQDKCLSDLVFTTEQLGSTPYFVSVADINFLCKFGILSKHKIIGRFGKREHKLSYLHKSYLEYFAALFVASFDSNHAFDDVVKTWNSVDDVLQYEAFFCFFVGFSCEKGETLFEEINHTISDDISSFSRKPVSIGIDMFFPGDKVNQFQNMVLHCFKEVRNSYNPNLPLKITDFIFSAFDIFSILRYWNFNVKGGSVGDDGSSSDDSSSSDDDLFHAHIGSSDNVLLEQLLSLNRTCVRSLMVHCEYFEELDEVKGLQYLYIRVADGCDVSKFITCMLNNKTTLCTVCVDGRLSLRTNIPELPVRSFHHLTALSLYTVTTHHHHLNNLVIYLNTNVHMETIILNGVYPSDAPLEYTHCSTLSLQNHALLSTLCLRKVAILCDNVNISSLKHFELEQVSKELVSCYPDLFTCIMGSQLEYLCIVDSQVLCYSTLQILTAAVRTLTCIKSLHLHGMTFPDYVCLQLHPDVTQVSMNLKWVTMSYQCFKYFTDKLVHSKYVIKVELCHGNISTAERETHRKLLPKDAVKYMLDYLATKPTIKIKPSPEIWPWFCNLKFMHSPN